MTGRAWPSHPAIRLFFIVGVIVFWTHDCASYATAIPPFPLHTKGSSNAFETPDALDARDMLPPELLTGEHHTVLDDVVPFRLMNHFTITSPFGQFEAYGEDMLKIRIQEIQALATIEEETNQLHCLAEGAKNAALSPFKFVLGLLTDPAKTILAIPKGMWRVTTRLQEMANGERGELEETESKELIGVSFVKRRIADEFEVDVYSSNPVLQAKLNSLSWAAYAGDTGIRLATIPIDGPANAVLTGTSLSTTIGDLLRDYAPEDLRRLNRKKLTRMDIKKSLIEEFLRHRWYSPRHETVLVQALAEMENVENRGRFLEAALSAEFEEEALFFQRMAEMMAAYHQNVAPINEIVVVKDQLIMGYTNDQSLVAMLPVLRLPWKREVADAADAITSWNSRDHQVEKIEIWIEGKPTPRAHHQLLAKGLTIHEHARDQLLVASSKDQTNTIVASVLAQD
ncbi:MAG: hypothetical protein GKS05_03900 [Nitrospirales bacterium]|nr:hypothetical protein [Nitrospirales bacterium]